MMMKCKDGGGHFLEFQLLTGCMALLGLDISSVDFYPTQHTRDLVPPSNPSPPPPYTRRMPKYSCLQVCCQSINLKMAIRAETCSVGRHNSTHAPTSPSLLNTHEISHPHPTPTRLHHTQDACQSIAAYKFVVNLST